MESKDTSSDFNTTIKMPVRSWLERLLAFQRIRVGATVLFHSTCAIAVTLVGKAALNGKISPVALLAVQTAIQTVLLTFVGRTLGWIQTRKPLAMWKSLIPLAVARTTGALAKTACLAVVDASFYQIARGLLLPFTLLLSFLVLGKKLKSFAPLSLVGAASVCVGFGIGMTTDLLTTNTSTIGLVLGVGSSFTTAVEAVVIKRFVSSNVQEKGDDMMQMAWMSNVLSTLLYSVLWLVFGRSTDVAAIAQSSSLLPTLCLAGVWGFLLTIATFLQISVTSPVTHMIVTAARGVAQSAFAVMLLPHESLGAGRLWSMGWILGGSALYGWAQDEAMTRAKQANATRLPLSHGEVTEKRQVVKGE